MTNNTAAAPPRAARLVAPLGSNRITVLPRNGFAEIAPRCELELNVFAMYRRGNHGVTKYLSVWVKPNSFAHALTAKQKLAGAGWCVDESWSENTMPAGAWLGVDGPVWEF